jgi:muramoyltetrapeptide carboxypeptidase LdcA involved in peptidoglycan recycling
MTNTTFDYKNNKLDYKVRIASFNARTKSLQTLHKNDEETLKDELAELGKDKPREGAVTHTIGGDAGRLTFSFPKLDVNKEGKLSGGNVAIINRGYQYCYQPVTGFAQMIDHIRTMTSKDFDTLKELTINHLPHSKRHIDPSKKPSDMVKLSENNPFTIADLPWDAVEPK